MQDSELQRAFRGAYDNLGTPLTCPAPKSHHHSRKNKNTNSHRYEPLPKWLAMLNQPVMRTDDLNMCHDAPQSSPDNVTETAQPIKRATYYDAPKTLLGEVAFQLERRIICQVFNGTKSPTGDATEKTEEGRFDKNEHQRFYGFTVLNLPERIRSESRDPKTGKRNCAKEAVLVRRFQDVVSYLRDSCGYYVHKHAKLCQDLINRHGLFNQPPDVATITRLGLDDFRSVRNHVIKLSDGEERPDLLVIVDCLRALALKTDKPILSF